MADRDLETDVPRSVTSMNYPLDLSENIGDISNSSRRTEQSSAGIGFSQAGGNETGIALPFSSRDRKRLAIAMIGGALIGLCALIDPRLSFGLLVLCAVAVVVGVFRPLPRR